MDKIGVIASQKALLSIVLITSASRDCVPGVTGLILNEILGKFLSALSICSISVTGSYNAL